MGHEIRADYDRVLMFSPCVEDWVGPEHPACFIRDIVDDMDLEAMGFCVPSTEVGRAGYAADLMLKARLYGYFNGIRTTRKLDKACREHMGLIRLTGMTTSDHNALWRFLNANRKLISQVFKRSANLALFYPVAINFDTVSRRWPYGAGSLSEMGPIRPQVRCPLTHGELPVRTRPPPRRV